MRDLQTGLLPHTRWVLTLNDRERETIKKIINLLLHVYKSCSSPADKYSAINPVNPELGLISEQVFHRLNQESSSEFKFALRAILHTFQGI